MLETNASHNLSHKGLVNADRNAFVRFTGKFGKINSQSMWLYVLFPIVTESNKKNLGNKLLFTNL